MVNRTLQAKGFKLVKQRRALGKYIPPERPIEDKDDYFLTGGRVCLREYNDEYRPVLSLPKRNYVVVADNAHHIVRIYYGDKGSYIVVHDHRKNTVKHSRTYKNIAQAKYVWTADLVGWLDELPQAPS